MRTLVYSFVCLLFLVTGSTLTAQNLSNRGRVFWVGYGHHQFMETGGGNTQEMVLYFSAEQPAQVTVTIRGTNYREVYSVPANTVITSKPMPKGLESANPSFIDSRLYTRPPTYPGGTGSEGIFTNKGIQIESDVPIVAYAHIYGSLSSGASMLMPVDTWGYSYTALNTRQYFGNSNYTCFSWIYIVARQNDTRVRIVPSVDTRNGRPANIPFEITLNEGEIFQLIGNQLTPTEGLDLTGTTVNSIANDAGECYPVAVFTGSSRTSITCTGANEGSGDNIMQQLFPYQAWGKRYLTTPTHADGDFRNRNINVFRIAVKDPTTVVKKNGMVLTGLNGFYYEYQSNTPDYIEADKPVLVAQYIPSANACGYSGNGDPELIYISPVEQAINQTGFYRNNQEQIVYNFLSLIIPDEGLKSLTIDGKKDFTLTYPHTNKPGYTVVIKRWSAEQAQCLVKSDSAFTAITYGLGSAESYGYNAGTLINNLNGVPAIRNEYNQSDTLNDYTCVNTPVELSVLMRYQPTRMQWKFSQLGGIITPATDLDIRNPVSNGQVTINGVTYYRYTLPGTFRFGTPGYHRIPLFTTHPSVDVCDNTEQIQYEVEVRGKLFTDFIIDYENCKASELIAFRGNNKFNDSSLIKRWEWSFSADAGTAQASGQEVNQLFNAGQHTARLVAADNNGCIADTTRTFILAAKPATPNFTVNAASFCEGGQITFTETNPETGVKKWYWSFGNGEEQTMSSGGTAITRNFTSYGKHTIRHVAMFSDACYSDTAVQEVVVYANPIINIQFPENCLPVDGRVQFASNNIVPDGQTISSYSWNFGDAAATPANPNTSSEADPTHVFTYGPYVIRYSVNTEMGCESDTLINAQFSLRPSFSYADPVVPPLCAIANQRISVASAIVTNGVPGSGIYKGKGLAPNGMLSLTEAGAGTHTLWYVYTTEAGCTDSVSTHITIHPQPEVNAGPDIFIAEGTTVQLQANAYPADGLRLQWSPGSLLSEPTILRPTYRALHDQLFVLSATGETGNCTATDTVSVKILRPVKVPNVFSPNGDGINDRWMVANLHEYQGCTVDVFNRYGQPVFRSNGYGIPWDGNRNGHPLPTGTYYYIIDLKNGFGRLTGSVTIVR